MILIIFFRVFHAFSGRVQNLRIVGTYDPYDFQKGVMVVWFLLDFRTFLFLSALKKSHMVSLLHDFISIFLILQPACFLVQPVLLVQAGFQLPDKIGICPFFDHFDSFAYQTHREPPQYCILYSISRAYLYSIRPSEEDLFFLPDRHRTLDIPSFSIRE